MTKVENKEIALSIREIIKGFVLEKVVRRFSRNSGAIYLPKKFIGKRYKVILIPIEDLDELML